VVIVVVCSLVALLRTAALIPLTFASGMRCVFIRVSFYPRIVAWYQYTPAGVRSGGSDVPQKAPLAVTLTHP
jgi:hypothetical protein